VVATPEFFRAHDAASAAARQGEAADESGVRVHLGQQQDPSENPLVDSLRKSAEAIQRRRAGEDQAARDLEERKKRCDDAFGVLGPKLGEMNTAVNAAVGVDAKVAAARRILPTLTAPLNAVGHALRSLDAGRLYSEIDHAGTLNNYWRPERDGTRDDARVVYKFAQRIVESVLRGGNDEDLLELASVTIDPVSLWTAWFWVDVLLRTLGGKNRLIRPSQTAPTQDAPPGTDPTRFLYTYQCSIQPIPRVTLRHVLPV
jgi:hypothetical protein